MQTVIMFKEQFTNTEKYPDNLLNNVVSLSINIFACNELKFFKQSLLKSSFLNLCLTLGKYSKSK